MDDLNRILNNPTTHFNNLLATVAARLGVSTSAISMIVNVSNTMVFAQYQARLRLLFHPDLSILALAASRLSKYLVLPTRALRLVSIRVLIPVSRPHSPCSFLRWLSAPLLVK